MGTNVEIRVVVVVPSSKPILSIRGICGCKNP
jgi:hypothetical protein